MIAMHPTLAWMILMCYLVSGYHGNDDANGGAEENCFLEADEKCQGDHSPSLTSLLESCPQSCVCIPRESEEGVAVNCTSKKLTEIPSTLPSDTVELILSDNKIEIVTTLPPLKLLQSLYLDHNKIHNLNVILPGDDHTLTHLDLSTNQLAAIPGGLPPTITVLKLTANNIQSFDLSKIEHLTELGELYLDQNRIELLAALDGKPQNVPFTYLTKLALNRNSISELTDGIFSGMANLRAITLSYNEIGSLKEGSFKGLSNLEFLDLKNNKISVIANNTFKGMSSLKYLYLGHNNLMEVPLHLPYLEWFDLSYNQIKHINESLSRADLYPIEMINIAHNPLHCDCKLVWLKELWDRREYMLKYMDVIEQSVFVPVCASPTAVADDSWDLLGDDLFKCEESKKSRPNKRVIREEIFRRPENPPDPIDERLYPRSASKKDIRLSVAVGHVSEDVVTIHWRNYGHDECEWVFIQYYIFGHRDGTTLLAQVAYSSGHYRIKHLKPATNYIICIIPKVTDQITLGDTHLNSCVEIATLTEDFIRPVTGWLAYMPDDKLLTYFIKLISSCFIVSLVLVGVGVAVYEIMMKLSYHIRGEGQAYS